MRVLLAGCGSISLTWLKAVQKMPDVEMVGFVDLDTTRARSHAEEFGAPDAVVGADLDAVLTQTKPDIVFDCTIPAAHYDVVLTALKHGCHVLGEKPLAENLAQAREMIAAAQRAGKLYAVMQNRRYEPNIVTLKKFLQSEQIGKVTTVHSDFFIGVHIDNFRTHMPHVLLLDMAIHTFDAARYISGADPVSVYCKEWNPSGSWFDYDASAVAIFEMTNGVVYTYRGSWCSEGLITTWESDWRIIGEKGTVKWDGAQNMPAQVVDEIGWISKFADVPLNSQPPAEWGYGHESLIRDFIDCVNDGGIPQTTASDNVKSLAMVMAAIESAQTGMPVKVVWE